MLFDLSKILDQKKAKVYFERLIVQNKKIELKSIQMKRSVTNNAYLHVCISIYAIEFGYTIYEAKTYLKRNCHFMTYQKNNVKYLIETSKQTDKELCDFIDWIRNHASQQGLYILTPEEYKENKFNIDRSINKYKQYL